VQKINYYGTHAMHPLESMSLCGIWRWNNSSHPFVYAF